MPISTRRLLAVAAIVSVGAIIGAICALTRSGEQAEATGAPPRQKMASSGRSVSGFSLDLPDVRAAVTATPLLADREVLPPPATIDHPPVPEIHETEENGLRVLTIDIPASNLRSYLNVSNFYSLPANMYFVAGSNRLSNLGADEAEADANEDEASDSSGDAGGGTGPGDADVAVLADDQAPGMLPSAASAPSPQESSENHASDVLVTGQPAAPVFPAGATVITRAFETPANLDDASQRVRNCEYDRVQFHLLLDGSVIGDLLADRIVPAYCVLPGEAELTEMALDAACTFVYRIEFLSTALADPDNRRGEAFGTCLKEAVEVSTQLMSEGLAGANRGLLTARNGKAVFDRAARDDVRLLRHVLDALNARLDGINETAYDLIDEMTDRHAAIFGGSASSSPAKLSHDGPYDRYPTGDAAVNDVLHILQVECDSTLAAYKDAIARHAKAVAESKAPRASLREAGPRR